MVEVKIRIFIMFATSVYIPMLANLQQSKLRYIADLSSPLSLKMLREAYLLAVVNLKEQGIDNPEK